MNVGDSGIFRADSGVLSEPFGFLRTEYYNFITADAIRGRAGGNYWTSFILDTAASSRYGGNDTLFRPTFFRGTKGYGFALRCVALLKETLDVASSIFFTRADSGIISEPFAFLRSGYYYWRSTGLGNRSSHGYYWSSHTYSTAGSRYQSFYSTYFSPQVGGRNGSGFTVRCVSLRLYRFISIFISGSTRRESQILEIALLKVQSSSSL